MGRERRLFLIQHAAELGSGIELQLACITVAGQVWLCSPLLTVELIWVLGSFLLPLYHGPAPLPQQCSLFYLWLLCPGKKNRA